MRAVLLFNYYFQKYLNDNSDCTELFDMFASTDSVLALTEKINHSNTNYNSRKSLFLIVAQNISKITANQPINKYFASGIDFLQKQDKKEIEQFWNYKSYSVGEEDISHIHEQYGVYYISMYYMDFFQKKQPYRFMVQFFALFYLQNCFEAFVYSGSKGKLTFSDIIEIYSKTARVYEHSYENKNLETTYAVLEKNEMTLLPFLLSLT